MDPAYVSVSEFTRVFGIGRSTLYKMLARKQLRAVKLGDRTLIDVAKTKEFLANQPAAEFASKAA
jgi:excisionase family DNA binding protein